MAPTKKTPGPPEAPVTAYGIYVKMVYATYSKLPGAIPRTMAEIAQQCQKQWLSLPAEERAHFEQEAENDVNRYRRELEAFKRPVATEKKKKPAKKPKDPNRPKRPLSSFFLFCSEERPNVRALYPEYKAPEVAKELGCRWRFLDAGTKARYEMIAANARIQYDQELQEYLNNLHSQPLAAEGAKGGNN